MKRRCSNSSVLRNVDFENWEINHQNWHKLARIISQLIVIEQAYYAKYTKLVLFFFFQMNIAFKTALLIKLLIKANGTKGVLSFKWLPFQYRKRKRAREGNRERDKE